LRLDWELARRGYRRYAAYPAATIAGLFTNTVFGFMIAYILLGLYEHRTHVGGYSTSDTLTYVWITQGMLAAIAVWGWYELALRIRTGDIATDLTRPIDPLRAGLAFDYGRALYQIVFRGVPPLVVGALVFDLTAPRNPLVWLAFAMSVALAIGVSFGFRFLYNSTAFWLLHYRGVMVVSVLVASLFSGLYIPVVFFPDWLKAIAYATPFPAMLQIPVDIFVGHREGPGIAVALLVQAGWLVLMLGICRVVFAAGTRRLVVQGG
jgi:viologen exporter family transport system permease protein